MSYGPPLFRYDGSASLTYSQAEQSLRFEGRFRANQFNDGSLVIGLAPTALPIGHISDSADDGLNVSVKGLTKDGWSLETLGNTLAPSPIALLLGSAKHIYRPHYLRAYPDDGSMDDHNKVRFLLSTLLFHQPAHRCQGRCKNVPAGRSKTVPLNAVEWASRFVGRWRSGSVR